MLSLGIGWEQIPGRTWKPERYVEARAADSANRPIWYVKSVAFEQVLINGVVRKADIQEQLGQADAGLVAAEANYAAAGSLEV